MRDFLYIRQFRINADGFPQIYVRSVAESVLQMQCYRSVDLIIALGYGIRSSVIPRALRSERNALLHVAYVKRCFAVIGFPYQAHLNHIASAQWPAFTFYLHPFSRKADERN